MALPPLRDRPEDIPLLAQRFVQSAGAGQVRLSPATIASLQCDPWPGNVRELRNVIERISALGAPDVPTTAPELPNGTTNLLDARAGVVSGFERDFLAALLERTDGNVSEAARAAGVSRRHLYRLLEQHGLKRARETD